MGLFRLVNVPTAKSGLEIRGHVEGENVRVICGARGSTWRDGHSVSMTDTFIGDHMLAKPEELRRMYANDLATVIQMARDAGYAQAMAELRSLIGAKAEVQCR